MDYKQRAYKKAMMKRNEERKRIEEFSKSQACKDMLSVIREKRKPSAKVKDLPF